MFKRIFLLALALSPVLLASLKAQTSRAGNVTAATNYAADWGQILSAVVTPQGLVRYNRIDQAKFNSVLKAVEDFDVSTLDSDDKKKAFWFNAYNILMVKNILDNPRVRNIETERKFDAFFKTNFKVATRNLSLDQIENTILRRQGSAGNLANLRPSTLDPRLHVALNCAAVSCPQLRTTAFTPQNVNTELEAAMRDFANSTAHFKVQGNTVTLSSIIDWFGSDFDGRNMVAGDFILRYMNRNRANYTIFTALLRGKNATQLKATRTIQGKSVSFAYNWTVNRV